MTWHEIRTESGSIYWIGRDDAGAWWLSARNVANPASAEIGGLRYAIAAPTPWPPIIGYPIVLAAMPGEPESARQMLPGGGKWTSRVVRVDTRPAPPERAGPAGA